MDRWPQTIIDAVGKWGAEYRIAEERLVRLQRYFTELMKWRQKVNLVSRSTPELEVIDRHFVDSLSLLPHLKKGSRLLDIGSGAGFPGLVCRTVLPELGLCLVEPRQKRVHFLRHIVRTLELTADSGEIIIYQERMAPDSLLCAERFTHITCRAVTGIGPFLQMVSGFSGSGAALLLMKGRRWEQELEAAQPVLHRSGYRLERVEKIVLPLSGMERFLLNFTETERL